MVITDKPENTVVLGTYQHISELNQVRGKVAVVPLKWGLFDANFFALPKLDVILAADCFYDPKDFDEILATVYALLEMNPGGRFVTVYQERRFSLFLRFSPSVFLTVLPRHSSKRSLQPLLLKWKLTGRAVPLDSFGFGERQMVMYSEKIKDLEGKLASLFLFEITRGTPHSLSVAWVNMCMYVCETGSPNLSPGPSA